MSQRLTHLLAEIVRNTDLQTPIREAVLSLQRSHLLTVLRELGKPRPQPIENINYLVLNACENSRVAGYNECLDDIQYFFERFVSPLTVPLTHTQATAYFAEIDKLVAKGELSPEEAKKMKEDHGKQPKLN